MLVKQLVGRYAGQIVDLPYAEATACLAAGTVCKPDETPRIRGAHMDAPASENTVPAGEGRNIIPAAAPKKKGRSRRK